MAVPILKPVRLTREGRYWLGVGGLLWLVGLLKGINLILLLAYILLMLWALNAWSVRRMAAGLNFVRRVPKSAFVGTEANWELVVETSAATTEGATVTDRIGDEHELTWGGIRLTAFDKHRLRRRWLPRKWGLHRLGPVEVRSSYPFGLFERGTTWDDGGEFLVLPRSGTIHIERFVRWYQSSGRPDERQRRTRRALGEQTDTAGLRDFRPGDSPRWIHWKTTARRNQLMVREFDQATCRELTLIVDLIPDRAVLERTIEMAATIIWEWPRQGGGRLSLILPGGGRRIDHEAGPGPYWPLLRELIATAMKPTDERAETWDAPRGGVVWVSASAGGVQAIAERLGRPVVQLNPMSPPDFYRPPTGPPSDLGRHRPRSRSGTGRGGPRATLHSDLAEGI